MSSQPVWLYHITPLANLAAIIQAGELRCHNQLQQTGTSYQSIAYDHIQDRRSTTRVPCGPGGTLHDYVPFYFAPRSPMLYTIHRGNVPAWPYSQEEIVHLVTSVESIQATGLPFVFTDGHAIVAFTQFFADLSHLNQIDWDVVKSSIWYDTPQHPDRKRRKQAEFLVHGACPWGVIVGIGVQNAQIQARVEQILQALPQPPVVRTRPAWYY